MSSRYLTKSRFKLAMECETKLFYTNKKDQYADQSIDDPLLEALAEGGFQVGELAKFYFCEDPVEEKITIDILDHDVAFNETEKRLKQKDVVIAEAAFRHENLFIRADVINKKGNNIELVEVKAKSWDEETDFYSHSRSGEIIGINSSWMPYLYDVAFQKYVICKSHPEFKVKAFLMLANKSSTANVDGLNQIFKLDKSGDKTKVIVKPGTKRSQLGNDVLIKINVDEEVEYIWNNPYESVSGKDYKFEEYVSFLSKKYSSDKKIKVPVSAHCYGCQFDVENDDAEKVLLSGFRECWKEQKNLKDKDFQRQFVFELWCGFSGNRSIRQELLDEGKIFLKDVSENYFDFKPNPNYPGLAPNERRNLQILYHKKNITEPYIDKVRLRSEIKTWQYPLHFIDFETSKVAIPFHKGRRPYESIAFQFSHHQVEADGRIAHKGQYLCSEPGKFPNYDFVRALKKELEKDEGTVFRYHNHENTILRNIYGQLSAESKRDVPDKDELCKFIDSITQVKGNACGNRNMIDLYKIVINYYYSAMAKGKNGLKYILPSAISNSEYLQEKYSKPIYGVEIPSLNYKNKIWITKESGMDPYATLEPIFAGIDNDDLDALVAGMDDVKEGGAAMTAYCKLQFAEVPELQRKKLCEALLRYCELDTFAMVMIWESWMELK